VKPYLTYFRKSFKQSTAYRTAVWLQIVGSVLSVLVQVSVWRALIGAGSVNGITLDDMVTYAIVNAIMLAFIITRLFNDVDARLRTGDISIDLLRPIQYPFLVLADQLGRAAFRFVFVAIPIVTISGLLFGFSFPPSIVSVVSFPVVLVFALLISFSIGYLIALLSFWFLTTFHFSWAIGGLVTLFSGSFLPLWFFPDRWEAVARALPFQFLGFIPAAVWLGQIQGEELIRTFIIGAVWTVILLLTAHALWRRATRDLVVQGG
jgi:ABC-2 type transport system permease protein